MAVEPHWSRAEALQQAEAGQLRRVLADGGVELLLGSLLRLTERGCVVGRTLWHPLGLSFGRR